MAGRLKGKIAVVTAAGQGIGRAIAEAFVREGATVHASDVDRAKLEEMRAKQAQIADGAVLELPHELDARVVAEAGQRGGGRDPHRRVGIRHGLVQRSDRGRVAELRQRPGRGHLRGQGPGRVERRDHHRRRAPDAALAQRVDGVADVAAPASLDGGGEAAPEPSLFLSRLVKRASVAGPPL